MKRLIIALFIGLSVTACSVGVGASGGSDGVGVGFGMGTGVRFQKNKCPISKFIGHFFTRFQGKSAVTFLTVFYFSSA